MFARLAGSKELEVWLLKLLALFMLDVSCMYCWSCLYSCMLDLLGAFGRRRSAHKPSIAHAQTNTNKNHYTPQNSD